MHKIRSKLPKNKRDVYNKKDKRENVNIDTGLYDINKNKIITGDMVKYHNWAGRDLIGIVLWSDIDKCFGMYFNMLWHDDNKYSTDSYTKFIKFNKDNGMRMQIQIIEKFNGGVSNEEY